jgi:hypothetical protein
MSRPDVDVSLPNVNVWPLRSPERSDSRGATGDEYRVERRVDVALRDRVCAGHLQSRLYAGESAEPDEIEIANFECCHRCGVIGHRAILDRDAERSREISRDLAVQPLQFFGVLVRYRRDPEDRRAS